MKLRDSIYLLFIGTSLSWLSSCAESDDFAHDHDRVAVTFTPQIEGSEPLHPSSRVDTRAVAQSWSAGDQVGIAMVASFDQSTQADMAKVDFLYHKGTTAYNKTSSSAALDFSHKLSKIIINATTTTDATAVTLSSLAMTITGTPGSVSASLADGLITAGGTNATIAPYHTNVTDSRVATAILVPHAATAGRTITFTATEGNFTYTFPSDDLAFESNCFLRF